MFCTKCTSLHSPAFVNMQEEEEEEKEEEQEEEEEEEQEEQEEQGGRSENRTPPLHCKLFKPACKRC